MVEQEFVPDHILFIATVTLENPSMTIRSIEDWLTRMVAAVDMKVLAGPFVVECFDPGNEGITGVIVLSTSHCNIHAWTAVPVPYLTMDLYSCRAFSVEPIMDMLAELGARVCDFEVIDRNHADETELLSGSMHLVDQGCVDFRLV
jgi:S-adenosylmethionine/arginine decarboxylase-like enzyme